MGIIISSFKGCGKDYLKNTQGDKIKIFDAIESIELDENDDDSFESYFNNVMDSVEDNDIIFIGSSERIRDKFNENKVDYDVFYPSKERRGEFIENQVRKRARPNDIRDMDKNFEKWVQEIDDDDSPNCYKHKLVEQGEFIGGVPAIMRYIDSIKQTQINSRSQNNQQETEEGDNDAN
jgi:hypothetical protein